jgi:hypothetical protein
MNFHWSPSLTRWLCIYQCSSLFKYCDIVIKNTVIYPFRCSVFRCSVPFKVRSFDVQSFDVRSHSTFSLSIFGPIRGSVFRCSIPFDVRSFEVWSFFRRSVFRGSVFRGSVIRGLVTVLIFLCVGYRIAPTLGQSDFRIDSNIDIASSPISE